MISRNENGIYETSDRLETRNVTIASKTHEQH